MKISVVGAGVQGSAIAFFLAKNREVSKIVCSDVSLDRAKRLARNLGSSKISAMKVDASNASDLAKVIDDADVVINAAVPRFNLTIMDAALKSGAHYVDLAADTPVVTNVEKELKLDSKWKDAGLTAVINQGGPFVMSILARYAADRLDKVDAIRLRFGWRPITREKEVIPVWTAVWSPEVAITEWTANPAIFENGKYKEVPQFSGIEEYPFPDPVGSVTLCFIEYEPVFTLPRFIGKGISYVDCKITLEPKIAALHLMGLASDKPIEVKGVKVAPLDVLLAVTKPPVEAKDKIASGEADFIGCYIAEVKGEKANEKITYTMYRAYRMSEIYKKLGATWAEVAVPATITATMLAKGEIKAKGVIPPEGLEPKPFLKKLAEAGMTFQESISKEVMPR
jgi:saccharopine dehydrogenase-like NADP-dependent oxidoreductase